MTRSQLKSKLVAARKVVANLEQELENLELVESGGKPAPAIAKLIKMQTFSFAVVFERRKALTNPRNGKPGISFTSTRRFATKKEATQHGTRFAKKHRHKAFHVIRVSKRANAWVNWKTGKTNPVIA